MLKVQTTAAETRILTLLIDHIGQVVSKDRIAEILWGPSWYEHYSDWTIDSLIYKIRQKLLSQYKLSTIRNRGYILTNSKIPIEITQNPPVFTIPGIHPTPKYLEYMNNPSSIRRVYSDLFSALDESLLKLPTSINHILAINSYSYDNIDTLHKRYPYSTVYFTNFDDRALGIHQQRIDELSIPTFHTLYDDIRRTRLISDNFDLIINDFRLNWNDNYAQDQKGMNNTYQLLKTGGVVLVSVVVDARYETIKFGQNQELAPLNLHKPWHFIGKEGLKRNCHTVPYYHKLFQNSGFIDIHQFDLKTGKTWAKGAIMVDPLTRPSFRRFLLRK